MSLPGRVRVRISSEAAGQISLTPVISQEMPVEELIEILLHAAGKDAPRIREMLARGSVVEGASRFRWDPIRADAASVQAVLGRFPDPEPLRAFDAARCFHARFRGPHGTIELPREIAVQRRLLSRQTFWSALMDAIAPFPPEYIGYSYRQRADEYRIRLSRAAISRIVQETGKLKHAALADRLRRLEFETVEFSVRR